MIFKYSALLVATLLTVHYSSIAVEHCVLPQGEKISLACTTACHPAYLKAAENSARALHYSLISFDLMNEPNRYFDAILSQGGGDPVIEVYPQNISKEHRDRLVAELSKFATQPTSDSLKRDLFEKSFFQSYFSDSKYRKIPALGICYGMQMMAMQNSLPLIVDLTHSYGIEARRNVDTIEFKNGKEVPFHSFGMQKMFIAKENHHQALDKGYFDRHRDELKNIDILAYSNGDRIPEIVLFKNRTALGTQFHPEQSDPSVARPVFDWLLEAACRGIKVRKRH